MRSRFVFTAVLLAVVACALNRAEVAGATKAKPAAPDRIVTVASGGRTRRALVHAPPAANGAARVPLVIALHGHGGTAARMRRRSGWNAAADARGFIVAYAEGASWRNIPWRSWNAGACCGYSRETGVDDIAYLRNLLDALIAEYPVDPARVYVTGISNGGMMAYRAACELSDRIAAIAVVAGAMSAPVCEPAAPVAVLIIHGTADRRVPYAGGRAANGRVDPSVAEAEAFWRRRNGNAAEVTVRTIQGGGHAWPEDAAATSAEFFARQSKRAGP